MNVIDPGHVYDLMVIDEDQYDRAYGNVHGGTIEFVKREGPGYPGNVGHHSGTIIQEVLRACIDRIKYVDNQIPSEHNQKVLYDLRHAIMELEIRAALRHGGGMSFVELDTIEDQPVGKNGHLLQGAGRE